jgi:hypothetical protein
MPATEDEKARNDQGMQNYSEIHQVKGFSHCEISRMATIIDHFAIKQGPFREQLA